MDFKKLALQYKEELLGSCLPFWLEKSQDLEYGGYFSCLNRDGSVFDTDEHLRIVNFHGNLKLDKIRVRQLHILNSNIDLGEVEVYDSENRAVYIDQSHVNIKTLTVNGDVLSATTETDGRGVAIYRSKIYANKLVISNKRIGLCFWVAI